MVAEWVIAGAAVAMVIVSLVDIISNKQNLTELKKSRKAAALPILEFGKLKKINFLC